MSVHSVIAASRFGLGARPDQPLPADPVGWLKQQLRQPEAPYDLPEGWQQLPTLEDGLDLWDKDIRMPPAPGEVRAAILLINAECDALQGRWIDSANPFRDRLVQFWSNHLVVSQRDSSTRYFLGHYVRTAISPHVTGRFGDMLVAAVRHPAMLLYLNQNLSIGPNSPVGQRQKRGLNENLARELLELHTLSPAAGYTQSDVTEMARLLSGLNVVRRGERRGTVFLANAHEPGPKTILGRSFPEGEAQIDQALYWLAEHEATHRHLATRLARHFIADEPPPAAVQRLFSVLRDTRGDLGAVAEALVDSPEVWQAPLGKLRAPQDFVTASFRAMGGSAEHGKLANAMCRQLGQPLLTAEQPIGWPDRSQDWISPEGALQRMERAYDMAGRFARQPPMSVAEQSLGPLLRDETRQAISRAGSMRDGLTLLLASPEFQRR